VRVTDASVVNPVRRKARSLVSDLTAVGRLPNRGDQIRHAGLLFSRVFCITAGGFLLLATAAALVFTEFDLSVGDRLPREGWLFLFAFNTWHHLLHLATSTLLLVAGLRRSWAPVGALIFGAIYVVLAPAGWIDGDDAFDIFYGSTRENLVHTALAVQGVGLGWLGLQASRAAVACRG